MPYPQFPPFLLFGTATAAYQIEGSPYSDGKGPSIWDTFSTQSAARSSPAKTRMWPATPTLTRSATLRLMTELGSQRLPFFHRLEPCPSGRARAGQPEGDGLLQTPRRFPLERRILPFITLFHWDTPQALQDKCGGFAGRDMANYFADYAEIVVNALGDRAKHWITLNEPWEHAAFGHLLGTHAPGRRNPFVYFRVAHHQLLGHSLAVERIRAASPDARVGITLSLTPIFPATDQAEGYCRRQGGEPVLQRFLPRRDIQRRLPESALEEDRHRPPESRTQMT